jgi:hypothetical protein
MADKDADKKSKETDQPWKRPGQVAQNPSGKPPSKKDLEGTFEQVNKTS